MLAVLRLLLLALLPVVAQAQSAETVLMPGDVVAGHAKWEQDCRQCHRPFDKAAQSQLCADCHKEVAQDLRGHRRFHGRLKDTSCRQCHTEHQGRHGSITRLDKDKFDHDRTDFPLRGAHRETRGKCRDCHSAGAKYRDARKDCLACHRKDDVHKDGLGHQCEKCHNDVKWKQTTFDHDKTRFRIEGEHAGVACNGCHTDRRYRDTPRECAGCHKEDDKAYGHRGRFGDKCAACHTVDTWNDSIFDHGQETKFGLKGRHRTAECTACHKAPLYTDKLPLKCFGCHRKDDDSKGHQGGLGEKCDSCHNEKGWKDTNFDHDADTDYPLTGKHAKARCESCHKDGVTVKAGKARDKLPKACNACHRKDDDDKGHKGKFGGKCETCHTTKAWKDMAFDHELDTKYPLRGKHFETKCSSCHTGALYADKLSQDCDSCHRKDDAEKGHKGKLGKRCGDCHGESSWRVRGFDHNRSRYPLTGRHAITDCKKCHPSVAFRDTTSSCNGCHEKEDVHKGRLGTGCEQCHSTRTWKGWLFDHNKTRFALDGAHGRLGCHSCHQTAVKDKPKLDNYCLACHAHDDVHGGHFGSRCERCHTTTSWRGTHKQPRAAAESSSHRNIATNAVAISRQADKFATNKDTGRRFGPAWTRPPAATTTAQKDRGDRENAS